MLTMSGLFSHAWQNLWDMSKWKSFLLNVCSFVGLFTPAPDSCRLRKKWKRVECVFRCFLTASLVAGFGEITLTTRFSFHPQSSFSYRNLHTQSLPLFSFYLNPWSVEISFGRSRNLFLRTSLFFFFRATFFCSWKCFQKANRVKERFLGFQNRWF